MKTTMNFGLPALPDRRNLGHHPASRPTPSPLRTFLSDFGFRISDFRLVAGAFLLSATLAPAAPSPALALHPENPHYFLWRDQPTVLITSGEHYGAVLNLDFDYATYFSELAAKKLNLTRTFTGAYVEPSGAFGIADNSMAPKAGRFICPWARSAEPGYANGGNKFDLTQWDPAYFARLKDFVGRASQSGVVVEMNLFCPFYDESQWRISPQNAANNVNGLGRVARTNVYTLDRHGGLLAAQEAMTRKIVTELKDFDNVYYELCNEPYFGGVTLEWQHHLADVITAAEKELGVRHLISQNIANGKAAVRNPHPAVSIFNFHYASPPETVGMNYALNKVIGDNETGFKGTNDAHYRREGWEFILAGGALYNNLDYSFTAGHERGDYVYPAKQPGGGNPVFRAQLTMLRDFIRQFEFIRMKPEPSLLKSVPAKARAHVLAEPGRQYAACVFGLPAAATAPATLSLEVPAGPYRVSWLNPITGETLPTRTVAPSNGTLVLSLPPRWPEAAVRIVR